MNDVQIVSVGHFFSVLRANWNKTLVFRGEDSDTYKLLTKFGRSKIARTKLGPSTERRLLDDFKRRAASYMDHTPSTDWDWLAIAQHHGLATRYLDWTTNPLIAAFFATRVPGRGNNRVIYAIDDSCLATANESRSPFDLNDESVFYRPRHAARRIGSQEGLFTVHGLPRKDFEHACLQRWLISSEHLVEFHTTLWSFQINDASVFQDLDGLARHLNFCYIDTSNTALSSHDKAQSAVIPTCKE